MKCWGQAVVDNWGHSSQRMPRECIPGSVQNIVWAMKSQVGRSVGFIAKQIKFNLYPGHFIFLSHFDFTLGEPIHRESKSELSNTIR